MKKKSESSSETSSNLKNVSVKQEPKEPKEPPKQVKQEPLVIEIKLEPEEKKQGPNPTIKEKVTPRPEIPSCGEMMGFLQRFIRASLNIGANKPDKFKLVKKHFEGLFDDPDTFIKKLEMEKNQAESRFIKIIEFEPRLKTTTLARVLTINYDPVEQVSKPEPPLLATTNQFQPMEPLRLLGDLFHTLLGTARDTSDNYRKTHALCQALLDGNIDPKTFMTKLELIDPLPTPKILPFLYKSLTLWHQIRKNQTVSVEKFLVISATGIIQAQASHEKQQQTQSMLPFRCLSVFFQNCLNLTRNSPEKNRLMISNIENLLNDQISTEKFNKNMQSLSQYVLDPTLAPTLKRVLASLGEIRGKQHITLKKFFEMTGTEQPKQEQQQPKQQQRPKQKPKQQQSKQPRKKPKRN